MIELVGFDGDDTLWHSEGYYRAAHAEFECVLGSARGAPMTGFDLTQVMAPGR